MVVYFFLVMRYVMIQGSIGLVLCKWMCVVCGFIYDEVFGFLEEDIVLGMCWEDVLDIWMCLDCGVIKDDFEMIEVD